MLLILLGDVWLRGHTFGPTVRDRWGLNLWPENGPSATTEPLDCDEAAYAYIGRRLVAGDALYRDLTENKPPLGYWLYALAVALGGANELAIRMMPLPYVLATIALLWWIALRVRGPVAACVAAGTYASVSTDPFVYANGANMEHFLNFFTVASLAALIWGWGRPARLGLLLAGALLGAACLVKQVAVVHLPVYLLALWLRPGRGGAAGTVAKRVSGRGTVPFCSEDSAKLGQSPAVLRQSLSARLADGLWLMGGLAAVVAVAGLVVVAQGAGRAAFDDVLVYGRAIAADAPRDPYAPSPWIRWLTGNADPKGVLPPPFGNTDYLVWWGRGSWPLWLAGLAGLAWLFVRPSFYPTREPTDSPTRQRDALIALWTLSACVQVVLPGMYWAHYYMLPLPGLALLAAVGLADAVRLTRSDSARTRRVAACCAVLLASALAAMAAIQARDYLGNSPQDLARKFKGGGQWIVLRDFGREIAARKRVWSDPRLFIWGWQSPLLIYGELDSASRHFFADELIKTADRGFPGTRPATRRLLERRTDEIMSDLRRRPPELVMAGHPPFPALATFLHEHYLPSRLDQGLPDGRGLWVERSRYGAFETARAPGATDKPARRR